MILKIIEVKRVNILLFIIISNFFLFSTIVVSQTRYTGVTEQNQTGSKGISSEGLVVSYDFETYTGTGMLKDFSSFKHHGKTLRNLDTLGLIGQARKFSTLADIVVLPDNESFNLEGPISVAVWLNITTLNKHQHILACNDKFVLWVTKTNKFKFADTQGNSFTSLKETVKADGWHSVIAVWTGTKGDKLSKYNIKIFVDGIQLAGTYSNYWQPNTMKMKNACVIGSTLHGAKWHQELPFEGAIDELQIFSRALNNDEIKAHATK